MNFLFTLAANPPVILAATRRHFLSIGFTWSVHASLAIIAGVLILIRPKLLNFIVALYLILIGLSELLALPK